MFQDKFHWWWLWQYLSTRIQLFLYMDPNKNSLSLWHQIPSMLGELFPSGSKEQVRPQVPTIGILTGLWILT